MAHCLKKKNEIVGNDSDNFQNEFSFKQGSAHQIIIE
jgi:hypothetical protein